VETSVHAAAIVKATLILGRSLGIPVLAEGVETQRHLDFLREEGCDSVQGYLFGRPMPVEDLRLLIGEMKEAEKSSNNAGQAAEAA
jgi:EAL domain-containing protein (putative c-di-GMP-specific phosphodiesterase class I)